MAKRPLVVATRTFSTDYHEKLAPYMIAIGRLATKWAEFEFRINSAIWELANIERFAGACITSQMIGPGPRFRALVALLHLRGAKPELINAFNSMASDAEGLGRQRNRYFHDPMARDNEDDTIARMEVTADRKLKFGFIPVEIKALTSLLRDVDKTQIKFCDLFERVRIETPPWPRIRYEQSPGIRLGRPRPETDLAEPELPLEPSPQEAK